MPRGALQAGVVPHDLFRIPVQDYDDIDPAKPAHQDLGHVDAPPFIRLRRPGFAAGRRPLGFQAQIGRDQEVMRPHEPQDAFLIDRQLGREAQVGPNATIAPERRLDLQCLDAGQQVLIPLDHSQRPLPRHPSSSSLVFNSRVSSPTSCFSRAFSCARRASRLVA
jgi:hypothetical protein